MRGLIKGRDGREVKESKEGDEGRGAWHRYSY